MARPRKSKCQHFRGKLIAHAIAHLVQVHHTAFGLTRWFEIVCRVPRNSFPDKMFREYLNGVVPFHARLQQILRGCPKAQHWIRHPLYRALSQNYGEFDELLIDAGEFCEVCDGDDLIFFRWLPNHWAVDVELARLLTIISGLRPKDRLRVQCWRYFPTLLAVTCYLTPVGFVRYALFDLINSRLGIALLGPAKWVGDGWPKTRSELDALVAFWAKWINAARLVGLINSDESAAKLTRLVQKLADDEQKHLFDTLTLAANEHVSIFHYPILRRLYQALRRHPPFMLQVGDPPKPGQLVN